MRTGQGSCVVKKLLPEDVPFYFHAEMDGPPATHPAATLPTPLAVAGRSCCIIVHRLHPGPFVGDVVGTG
jgi:hypothetical protein